MSVLQTDDLRLPGQWRNRKVRTHHLKTWPEYFRVIVDGRKTVEVRKNDRWFMPSDLLHLREYDPVAQVYTGVHCWRVVTHVLYGGQFGIEDGYVVMSIAPLPDTDEDRPHPVPLLLGSAAPRTVRKSLAAADFETVLSKDFRRRFNSRIRPAENGCIEWLGSTNGDQGYGKISVRKGLTIPAHNAAWMMHYREPIPEHLELDHLCVNPPCTSVAHLEAVTSEENIRRANERSKVRIIRTATVRLRAGKYQVRWRELVDGKVSERGRTFASSEDATQFMESIPSAAVSGEAEKSQRGG